MEISGFVAPGFEDLADVYSRLAAENPDHASALSVFFEGNVVARLGVNGYTPDDRQLLFSVSKVVVTLALVLAHEEGILDLDAPISQSWRDFGAGTATTVSLRDVLSHRSGFFRLVKNIDVADLLAGGDIEALNGQTRDTRFEHAYHAFTFGSIVAGTLESLALPSIAVLINSYLAEPLQIDTILGISQSDAGQIRPVRFSPPAMISMLDRPSEDLPTDQALVSLLSDAEIFNSPDFLAAQVPSMGVISSSDSLARLMAATIGEVAGVRLLTDDQREKLCQERSSGRDGALGVTTRFGTGVQLPFPRASWTSASAFGHEGAGGSVAFADPYLRLGVGFTTDLFPSSAGASPVITGMYSTLRHLVEQQFRQA